MDETPVLNGNKHSSADAEVNQPAPQTVQSHGKFNDAEYERWRKALDAKHAPKSAR